jgi:hypothetical protein
MNPLQRLWRFKGKINATRRKIMKSNTMYRRSVIAVIGVVLLILTATIASAKNPNPGVLPPNSHSFGMTYGEWSAEWWQYVFSLPVDNNPLFDDTGEKCAVGQSGKVFFLVGTVTIVEVSPNVVLGEAERDCTVPAGKAIFFPIINSECATAEGNGTTDEELRSCAELFVNHAGDLQAEIDGVPVQKLEMYRAESPLFSYGPLPGNNILQFFGFDAPAGTTSPSVSDGFYLMLAPLSAGEHTIHFSGNQTFTQAEDGFDFQFILDITYNLTVAPHKS